MVDVCMQANHLKSETETYEEKEQQLVNDCVNELSKSLHFYLCLSFCFPVTIHIYIVIFLFPMSFFSMASSMLWAHVSPSLSLN